MRMLVVPVIIALAIAPVAGAALAQTAKPSPIAPTPQKVAATTPRMKNVSGEVVSLDEAAKTLTLKQAGKTPKELTFTVADTAAKTLTGLKPGDRIRVGYVDEAGKLTAEKIVRSRQKAKL